MSPSWVGGGECCRMHPLHLCRGVRPPYECPEYDIKTSDDEASVLEICRALNTHSLSLLSNPRLPGVVFYINMGQMEILDILTVCKN